MRRASLRLSLVSMSVCASRVGLAVTHFMRFAGGSSSSVSGFSLDFVNGKLPKGDGSPKTGGDAPNVGFWLGLVAPVKAKMPIDGDDRGVEAPLLLLSLSWRGVPGTPSLGSIVLSEWSRVWTCCARVVF